MNNNWQSLLDRQPTSGIVCGICNRKFSTKTGLSLHVTRAHRTQKPKKLKANDRPQKKRKRYTQAYKKQVILEIERSPSRQKVIEEHKLSRRTVEKWFTPRIKKRILSDAPLDPSRKSAFKKRKRG